MFIIFFVQWPNHNKLKLMESNKNKISVIIRQTLFAFLFCYFFFFVLFPPFLYLLLPLKCRSLNLPQERLLVYFRVIENIRCFIWHGIKLVLLQTQFNWKLKGLTKELKVESKHVNYVENGCVTFTIDSIFDH